MLQSEDNPAESIRIVQGLSAAFDDMKVAQLLATALSNEGQASGRLAEVFNTIAPDPERKKRVLTMTRTMLSESAFGQSKQFKAIWSSMEELLISYNDAPFVSQQYRAQLDSATKRGDTIGVKDLPPEELAKWTESLGQEIVQRLALGEPSAELVGLGAQRLVAQHLVFGFERVHLPDRLLRRLDLPVVAAAEDLPGNGV